MEKSIKIQCPNCGNKWDINTVDMPKNLQTFDSKCTKCGAFVKVENQKCKPSLKDIIGSKFPNKDKDPIWFNDVYNYFKETFEPYEDLAIRTFLKVSEFNDIFEEFTKCLVFKKGYDFKDPIKVEGYTANMISKTAKIKVNPSNVYMVLTFLRNNKNLGEEIIKKGFPKVW